MNFDDIIDRVGTHSFKWDMMETLYGVKADEGISMWVADMDFQAPAIVTEALRERLDHGVYGYFTDESRYRAALANWLKTRHNFMAKPAHMIQVHGLVQAVSLALLALTEKGDGVITINPVYHAFGRIIRALGRDPQECPMRNQDGFYTLDLEALEANLKGHEKVLIFCSPHNPGGRVWTEAELKAIGEFAKKHNLYLISDEIHMDLVLEGKHHVFGSACPEVEDRLIYLFSSTKTFNLAGALTGTIYVPDAALFAKLEHMKNAMGISANLFGMIACTASYEGGADWLDALIPYLRENARIFDEGISKIPGAHSMKLQATYLAWVDFRPLGLSNQELQDRVFKQAKIAANIGETFGAGGNGFMRFNLATPRSYVERAVLALQNAFSDIQ